MPERKYKRERIGFITESKRSWCKEFSIVQWGDNSTRMYDIRKWRYGDTEEQCGKGISLNRNELIKLRDYIDKVLGTTEDLDVEDPPIDFD